MVNEQREAFLANRVLIEAKMHERESERYLKELAEFRKEKDLS